MLPKLPTDFFKEVLIQTQDKKVTKLAKAACCEKAYSSIFSWGDVTVRISELLLNQSHNTVHLYCVSYWEEQQLLSIDLARRVRVEMPSCHRSENVLKAVSPQLCSLEVWSLTAVLNPLQHHRSVSLGVLLKSIKNFGYCVLFKISYSASNRLIFSSLKPRHLS